MSTSNRSTVISGFECLKQGLTDFVERELGHSQDLPANGSRAHYSADTNASTTSTSEVDTIGLIETILTNWDSVFSQTLGTVERRLLEELVAYARSLTEKHSFSADDAYRILDSVQRLLDAVSASQLEQIGQLKANFLRRRYESQTKSTVQQQFSSALSSSSRVGLPPWREVSTPHSDVASGTFQQAEFAADLWQVYLGEGTSEYREPSEFFHRTHLTEGLRQLLAGAIRRLSGLGGDPVIQLQTNFGGGKTHSMLALYHLFSGLNIHDVPHILDLMHIAGASHLPKVNRAALVGNKISPGHPKTKPDGTVVRTLWGELAWQLGGRDAYAMVEEDDHRSTNPGDSLRALFNKFRPCLILIDEWVAYARQLHDDNDLPAGTFETQFSFAQALTESAKLADNCLLVTSLPASGEPGTKFGHVDESEVGGKKGLEALKRLRNIIGRVDSSWRPATAEDGFEIVRRRLFSPLMTEQQFAARAAVARAFVELYRSQAEEFPPGCGDGEYEEKIVSAYPIHPEIFDRLYTDWSTLLNFQRTRGVLRLIASTINVLWEAGDQSPLILPSNIAISDRSVQFELTRYLTDNWVPVIERDVDGFESLPAKLDREVPNLGKYSACRRVARTIYLGSAPIADASLRGIEDRRVKLGCVMPGESPSVFGDALRRLSSRATYLYQDGQRYWYSTQPTVLKLADDRAEQMKDDSELVREEILKRVIHNLQRDRNVFTEIHTLPDSSNDVPDINSTRLVVLDTVHAYSKDGTNPARDFANQILNACRSGKREFRNSLVFLAPDMVAVQDFESSIRRYLAWVSIVRDSETLELSPSQVRQAHSQVESASSTVDTRLSETFQWLLVPTQSAPEASIEWNCNRLVGHEPLANRVGKRLLRDEHLIKRIASTRLRMELDRIPLWRGNHVSVRQVIDDFGRNLYLPKMTSPSAILEAIKEGTSLLTWEVDAFAFADSYDEADSRYKGLRAGTNIGSLDEHSGALLVEPSTASAQLAKETVSSTISESHQDPTDFTDTADSTPNQHDQAQHESPTNAPHDVAPSTSKVSHFTRFSGTVQLNEQRVGRDASRIAEEVLAHLVALPNSTVSVRLDVLVEVPDGIPDTVASIAIQNGRDLGLNLTEPEDGSVDIPKK